MGEVSRVGPTPSLYIRLGVPRGGVVGRRDPGVLVRWLGSEVLFSRAGAPLLQGPETNLRADNRVFHADSSLTY
jgi:hypothetical protein